MMRRNDRHKQSGAALLLFMLTIIVATATILVSGASRDRLAIQQQSNTRAKLELARTALLDYVSLRMDRGDGLTAALPCPDIDDSGTFSEGEAHDSACGAVGVTVVGRLPWKTLGLPALKDSAASCLWYVVSGSWKDAGVTSAEMINADTSGSLQLYNAESGLLTHGAQADERPVAMVFAAMRPLQGQTRPSNAQDRQCAPGASASDYLDFDTSNGISNAALVGNPDGIELFSVTSARNSQHNDRVAFVTRADVAARLVGRSDFDTRMRELGLAAAACVASYATNNSGGVSDRRMPWPTAVTLSDYRVNAVYNDIDNGLISGRLPDTVDDSSLALGNTILRVLSDCDPTLVPAWTPEMSALWTHWKDHFFYAVGPSFAPNASLPSSCSNCLSVNGAGQYAAILIFAGERLGMQRRDAPPTDADMKRDPANYLEAGNALAVPGVATDFRSGPVSATFNDRLFCIDANLLVSEC